MTGGIQRLVNHDAGPQQFFDNARKITVRMPIGLVGGEFIKRGVERHIRRLVEGHDSSQAKRMQHMLLILLQLVSSLTKLARHGGAKALVAENLLLKQQLVILRRSRRRAPNLRFSDCFLFVAKSA